MVNYNKKVKIVYEDNNNTKVVRGIIFKEEDYLYHIRAETTEEEITIGKRSIIKVTNLKND